MKPWTLPLVELQFTSYVREMLKKALLAATLAALISIPIALVTSGCVTDPTEQPTERPPAESEVSARLPAAAIERQLAIRAADRAARAAALDAQGISHDALEGSPLELSGDGDTDYTGGHCNVRLFHCDPYPIGKGNHPKANAKCSQYCIDTIAYCADYSTAEIEYCCTHPDQNYRDSSGREYPDKHCMPSGEPNWETRCQPGLQP